MTQKKPKVSILVAAYNIEKYIEQCIASIINQDYNNLEIIIVDDNSSDNTSVICDRMANTDSRIKIIHHKKNTKLPGVRNTGLDNATGDYIIFVDGDDWLAPDFVSYMLKTITVFDADMAINKVNFTSRDLIQVKNEKEIEKWSAEKATAELLFPHLPIGAWNKIYRRDFLEKNDLRFRNLFTAEGETFISECAQKANCVAVGYRKVYYYRLNNTNSATTKYDIRQSEGAIEAGKIIDQNLAIRTPYTLHALKHRDWVNHFWNIRQIIKLNLRKEKEQELKDSIKFIRKNGPSVIFHEISLKKKVFFIAYFLFPITSAKIKNYSFDKKLKKDVATFEKEKQ